MLHNIFPLFPVINNDLWKNIYKSPFNIVRETRLQTLQYKIIHNTIVCNQRLKRIKIKESDTCSFCNLPDDIPHYFINCEHTKAFWKTWGLWSEKLTNFNIRECEDIIECILFGFPGKKNNTIIINI